MPDVNNVQKFVTPAQFASYVKPLRNAVDALVLIVRDHDVITPSATSWADVQAIVRAGLADKAFPIGTKMYCHRGNVTLKWDVIGIDHDTPADPQFTHSLTLQLHYCFPTAMQFDAPEALYYCETGLEAGTYHFTLSGTDYQFTASADIAAGSQLMLAFTGNVPSGITVAGTKGGAVSEGSIAVTAGSGGDELTDVNNVDRARYGCNNYKESAIRQWLNSSAAAGSVWTAQNNFDRPPDWAATTAGFMNGMDADFLAVLGNVTKTTAKNDSGSYTTDDTFFLLSRSEVYGGLENGVDEGAPYPYYANYSNLSSAGTGADANRVKYIIESTACQQFLRTPAVGQSSRVRHLNTSGQASGSQVAVNSNNPDYVAPACCVI